MDQSRTRERILVVDDEVDATEMLQEFLEGAGYAVTVAHTGPAALELARAEPPRLAILDISLPGMDGYELCRQLRAALPEGEGPFIVASSGYNRSEMRAKDGCFDEYLTKPIQLDQLLALVRRFAGAGGA